jgi:nitrogenase molybdenum-iron protein NifN
VPDYSDTLDGPAWSDYQQIPAGGTPLAALRAMGAARGSFEFAATYPADNSAGADLESRFGVPRCRLPLPLGVEASDRFFVALAELAETDIPAAHDAERGRLVDAYIDAHKYASGKRVAIFGDEDLVVPLCGFVAEIGMQPVLCASGDSSGRLRQALELVAPAHVDSMEIRSDTDFATIEELVGQLQPDLLIGSSKGYAMSRKFDIPLLRVGFPIHDRIGGARQLHVGYRGTQQLFDRIVNTLIAVKQDRNPVGYMNM